MGTENVSMLRSLSILFETVYMVGCEGVDAVTLDKHI